MAIYHLEAKVVRRGVGRSAVAAAAYMSCSQITNDYDGVEHNYTRKQGLVWQQTFLPKYAPQEWHDRAILWNAVEEAEKSKDSRLAREFVVALPAELTNEYNIALLTEFVQNSFVSDGMCADVAIHDTDGHNPHAHILLTVRPLNEDGTWQYKTQKEYLCARSGEERGFTASEYKTAQPVGWEKQYQYKVGKKKVYLSPSVAKAQSYERMSKYPKSTKFGRQNPISERWNSEEQLVLWRKAWADVSNCHLERTGVQVCIDHRSHAERSITEQPTIHEGVSARALEKKGILSDRCELNRQIREDNKLLRELKAQVQKLIQTVKNTGPAIAAALEKLRGTMLVFRYQLRFVGKSKAEIRKTLNAVLPDFRRYSGVVQHIRDKTRERKDLLSEKKVVPIFCVPRHMELARKVTKLTEELEELHSEKAMLLARLNKADDTGTTEIQLQVDRMESALKNLEQAESKYTIELNNTLAEYYTLDKQTAECDPAELAERRRILRVAESHTAHEKIQSAYGERYDEDLLRQADADVSRMLDENAPAWKRPSVRAQLQKQQQPKPKDKQKHHEQER